MFTGIVKSLGAVSRLQRRGGGAILEVSAPGVGEGLGIGDSIAVNGACVTVTARNGSTFACDLVPETLARSNLGTLQPGEEVNLEMPLRAGDRLDGHIVQGHVDVVGLVRSRRRVGAQEMLEVNVPFELTPYIAPKGSITVDGVSLTVVDVSKDRFRVALIPHTVASTTLGKKVQGSSVNVELDVLSKYVQRHLAARGMLRAMAWGATGSEAFGALGPPASPPGAPRPPAAQTPLPRNQPSRPAPRPTPRPAPRPASRPLARPASRPLARPASRPAARRAPKRAAARKPAKPKRRR